MKNLYLVRHGETDCNVKEVYYGATDCPLNDRGREDARRLHGALKARRLDLVFTSPLSRATETAALLLADRPVPLSVDDRLRELNFGDWEGRSWRELQDDPHWQDWGADWQGTRPPAGESFLDLAARVSAFYDDLLSRPEEDILIVSHHMIMMALICRLFDLPPTKAWHFRFLPGTYSHLVYADDFPVLLGQNLK